MKKLLSLFFISAVISFAQAQTNVSGGIFSNTTWTKANSPYIVTGTVAVFPGNKLTIEPGVVVKFDSATSLQMRDSSSLIAIGTKTDSIKFTTNVTNLPTSQFYYGVWGGILNGTLYAFRDSIVLDFVSISYAEKAIESHNGRNESDLGKITRVRFEKNYIGIDDIDSKTLDSCLFVDHVMGIHTSLYSRYNSCSFIGCENGIKSSFNDSISQSIFCKNLEGIAMSSSYVFNSEIVNNDWGIGNSSNINLENCTISNNDIGILDAGIDDTLLNNFVFNNGIGLRLYGTQKTLFSNNKICQNEINVEVIGAQNMVMKNTCWCENDSTKIADKILDGRDDVGKGLLDYSPWINCDSTVLPPPPDTNCTGLSDSTGGNPTNIAKVEQPSNIKLFPNPTKGVIKIDSEKFPLVCTIRNTSGQIILSKRLETRSNEVEIKGPAGLYFIELRSERQFVGTYKVIKE